MVTLTFILYLALMMVIGLVAYRRTKDLSDYVLGGRNLGPIPSALSAGASDMAYHFLTSEGKVYSCGSPNRSQTQDRPGNVRAAPHQIVF